MQLHTRLLISLMIIFISLYSYGQAKNDSLYTDFDLTEFKPVNPAFPQSLYKKGHYVRNLQLNKKNKEVIELVRIYRDSSVASRKAHLVKLNFGDVLAFKVLKEPGFEKVLIFGDYDYYYDSLLIRQDTIYFKEMEDNFVELAVVYPVINDTLTIKHGYRNTRTDFLKKISYQPALKNYMNWFPDNKLDYSDIYTFIKKDSCYELIKVDTDRDDIREYEINDIKIKYAGAGLSPFWLALAELAYP